MDRTLELLCDLLLRGVAFINRIGMQEAVAERARAEGVPLEIPDGPVREVSDEMRTVIIAERARHHDEFTWLYPDGPRDQLCVRFGLARLQVAGVLSADTKRANGGNGNGRPTAGNGITADPDTWPSMHGATSTPPMHKCRELAEVDWRIARAVIEAGRWESLRHHIATVRDLTVQQVAGMKAVISRGHAPAT